MTLDGAGAHRLDVSLQSHPLSASAKVVSRYAGRAITTAHRRWPPCATAGAGSNDARDKCTAIGRFNAWTALAAASTAAHHVFELSSGIGVVWQPNSDSRPCR